jgi:uncharacterized protein YlaI
MKCVDRSYMCESCEFRFEDLDTLRLHKRKMEGVCDSYSPFDHTLYIRSIFEQSEVKMESESKPEPEVKLEPEDEPVVSEPVYEESKNEPDSGVGGSPRVNDEFQSDSSPEKLLAKPREVRVRVKTISPIVKCEYCSQEYNIDDDSDAAFRLLIHVANHHPKENINFR